MADIPTFRSDFKILAEMRIEDARLLLRSRRQLGAYYLAGYAVECALKACIARQRKRFEFPPKRKSIQQMYSHNLGTLLDVAGLRSQLEKDMKADPLFAANWNTVRDWDSESRYKTAGLNGTDIYNAITGPNGVLEWIKLRW